MHPGGAYFSAGNRADEGKDGTLLLARRADAHFKRTTGRVSNERVSPFSVEAGRTLQLAPTAAARRFASNSMDSMAQISLDDTILEGNNL